MTSDPRPNTIGELRASGWRSRTVKAELRANLLDRLADRSRRPPRHRRLRGFRPPSDRERHPRRSRHRASWASAARPRPGWPGCWSACSTSGSRSSRGGELNDDPFAPVQPGRQGDRRARRRRDAIDWLPRDRRYTEKLATPGHHHRRPHRRGRPDQGRRRSLPGRRADHPLRPHPARQSRHLRDQRAARPGRAHPGRPAQHPRGARRPDPRLHAAPAARPVRRGQRQPRGLHLPRPDHHAAQGPPRLADPDPLPAHDRPRDRDHAARSSAASRRPPRTAPVDRVPTSWTSWSPRCPTWRAARPEISQRSGVSASACRVANLEVLEAAALKRAVRLGEPLAAPRISDLPRRRRLDGRQARARVASATRRPRSASSNGCSPAPCTHVQPPLDARRARSGRRGLRRGLRRRDRRPTSSRDYVAWAREVPGCPRPCAASAPSM